MKRIILGLLLLAISQTGFAAATTIALQRVVNDVATNDTVMQKGVDGAAYVYQAYRGAGERNEDSTTGTDYMSTSGECKATTFDTSTNSSTEYNGPALLEWIYVNTVLSAHTVVIKDNTTAKITLPASMAAGSYLPVPGMRFDTNFTVDPDDSSTGNITYCIRPLDSGQVSFH